MVSVFRLIQPIYLFFTPALLGFALFLLYRLVVKNDKAAGLALYLGLVVIVDAYLVQGLFIPGMEQGSIKFSEVAWCILILKDKRLRVATRSSFRNKFQRVFLLFIFFLLVAAFNSPTLKEGIFFFRGNIFPQMLAFFIAITGFPNEKDYIRFFNYLMGLVLICALYVIWLRFLNVTIIRSPSIYTLAFAQNIAHGRHGSFFGNPNYLGCFVILLTPVYVLLATHKNILRYAYFLTIILIIFMLSQTGSRSPLVCWVGSLLILGMVKRKKMAKFIPIALVMAIIFSVAMPGVIDTLTRRFNAEEMRAELTADEDVGRGLLWRITMEMIQMHPLGIGLGEENYLDTARDYVYASNYHFERDFNLDNPHNSYLEIAIMGGLQSLALFLVLLFMFFNAARKVIHRPEMDIFVGIVIGLLGYCAAMFTEPVLFKPMVANLFWIGFGLGIATIIGMRKSEPTAETAK